MKIPAFLLLCCLQFSVLPLGYAQTAYHRPGDLLIRLEGDAAPADVTAYLQSKIPSLRMVRTVSDIWRIYLLHFDAQQTPEGNALEAARRAPGVDVAQFNYAAEDRSTEPNDSLWSRQAHSRLLGLPEAWDISTGGLTAQGDTIVVAVLEKGAIMSHPDLRDNQWRNHAEVPRDGIDNDQNGFTDDYKGWNPRYNNDSLGERSSHGTSVNGIIGAKGNNKKGVAGVNWDVKLMNLGNVQFEDEIISAYDYVYKARKLYNQTKGEKGAFVVATNASFGLDGERAKDHPMWCDMYEQLGTVGVLSAGATSNDNVDVDVMGDMPSTCTSEFLIVVTNTDSKGVKVAAGFGGRSVDIGAPGEGAYSTNFTSFTQTTYGAAGGTSAATPQVSGVIALLYSYDCPALTADALTDPAACARRVRDLILNNSEPEASLRNITVTGRRLHLAGPSKEIRLLCNGSSGPLALSVRPNPTKGELFADYETPTFDPYLFSVHSINGQLIREEWVKPPQFGKKTYRFDAANLPTGFYTISIQRNKEIKSVKFIKN
jgi:subtilisin family serine protease